MQLPNTLSIDQRVDIQMAVDEYLASRRKAEEANKSFEAACHKMRTIAAELGNIRFVVQKPFEFLLVTTEECGDFEIDPIERI